MTHPSDRPLGVWSVGAPANQIRCANCGHAHLLTEHARANQCAAQKCECNKFVEPPKETKVAESEPILKLGSFYPEEVRTTSSTGGQKGVKPEMFSLIPVEALEIMARLYGFGAKKYAAHNWRNGYEWSKSFDSLFRHAFSALRGEDIDEETGLPHLAGAAFHCFTLMVFMQEHPEFDDRWKPVSTEDVAESEGEESDPHMERFRGLGIEQCNSIFAHDPHRFGDKGVCLGNESDAPAVKGMLPPNHGVYGVERVDVAFPAVEYVYEARVLKDVGYTSLGTFRNNDDAIEAIREKTERQVGVGSYIQVHEIK